MKASAEQIKQLREMTGCGVIECKKALEEANLDQKQAVANLKQMGLELAAKKGSREAKEGRIESYIHNGNKIGVMVEINCETDFVANAEEFVKLSKNIAMHIAAANPKYIKKDDVPADVLAKQDDAAQFIKDSCLLEQPYIKEPDKTVGELITALIATIRENIYVNRFARYKVNEVE